MIRLQKFLADAGVASRRASEQIILEGRVTVNGNPVTQLGAKVDPLHDRVVVDGKPLKAKKKIHLALNKPRGLVCSRNDELGRPTIYELLPKEWGHLHSIGRLDFNSEGLLFLTNDGELSLKLTHPRYGVHKKYIVTVDGKVDDEMVKTFLRGVYIEGERLKAERLRVVSSSNSQSVVEMDLAEGKYREIRRMFESQGRTVKRLVRIQVGKIKLGELKTGKWRTLTEPEIKSLLGAL
jgi:23S rRNA pseudouridine2605 synthase